MKKIAIILILALGTVLLLGGCGQSSKGNKYVGKWMALETNKGISSMKTLWRLEVTQNGENYILKESFNVSSKGNPSIETKSATLTKDGKLQVNPLEVYTFVESDNTLLSSRGVTYKKETPEELEKAKAEQAKADAETDAKYNIPVFVPKR